MTTIKGWKTLSHDRGYINETTGQTLTVKKKEFGEQYIVWIFPNQANNEEGTKISPEFPTLAKAEAFAIIWMKKNPHGTA
jgi:hypothetical protein